MKDLPADWYEESMRPLREEEKHWPEWMKKGVEDARENAAERMAKYQPPTRSNGKNGTPGKKTF